MKEKQTDPFNSSRAGIVFFGRIMANVSHEFNNVITVISELSGLLKDLSLMAQKGREIPHEKIISISDNISRQVARGKHLITHMNRFSHSTDESNAKVDLEQTIENMRVLTDRIFKCRQADLSFSPPGNECSLDTDPFELRRFLFACLDRFLDASSPEVSVTLHKLENGRELEMRVSGQVEGISHNLSAQFSAMTEQATELNGRLLCEQKEGQVLVRLILPMNRPIE